MEKLKITLKPRLRKEVKTFCLTQEAIERLELLAKKFKLSHSEVVNQILLKVSA